TSPSSRGREVGYPCSAISRNHWPSQFWIRLRYDAGSRNVGTTPPCPMCEAGSWWWTSDRSSPASTTRVSRKIPNGSRNHGREDDRRGQPSATGTHTDTSPHGDGHRPCHVLHRRAETATPEPDPAIPGA